MSKSITKVYYYEILNENNAYNWNLTTDKYTASTGLNSRTGTLQDLHDVGCIGILLTGKILHVDEGFFEWDSSIGEYEFIDEIKDKVLDRLEDKGMADSEIYEHLVSMKNYGIHSWCDLNCYCELLG